MTTQTDDTRRILEMLSQGKITVDDADRLIQAVSADRAAARRPRTRRRTPSRAPAGSASTFTSPRRTTRTSPRT